MPSPAKLAHLVLKTAQLDTMIAWYCQVLEAEVAFANDTIAFITYDDEHHRVAFVRTGATERPTDGHVGLHHVAFTYATLEDLIATYERLRDAGVEPFWSINHGPTTSMYFEDPDGNHLELQIDNFETESALQEWFESGSFQRNPIGVEFDPDELAERFHAGEPREALVAQ